MWQLNLPKKKWWKEWKVEEGEVTDESMARKRKPNFSMNEISVITENVKNHLALSSPN